MGNLNRLEPGVELDQIAKPELHSAARSSESCQRRNIVVLSAISQGGNNKPENFRGGVDQARHHYSLILVLVVLPRERACEKEEESEDRIDGDEVAIEVAVMIMLM